jgi:hypothetical protein
MIQLGVVLVVKPLIQLIRSPGDTRGVGASLPALRLSNIYLLVIFDI